MSLKITQLKLKYFNKLKKLRKFKEIKLLDTHDELKMKFIQKKHQYFINNSIYSSTIFSFTQYHLHSITHAQMKKIVYSIRPSV